MRRMVSSFCSPSLSPQFLGERFDRIGGVAILDGSLGNWSLGKRRFRQLAEHFRQSNGRIGGNGPRSLEIHLIHHCC